MITVLAVIAVLLVLNSLYVAAEFAGVSARRTRIRQWAEDGSSAARWVLRVVESPTDLDRYIAGCQVGITLSSLVLGAYGQAQLTPALVAALRAAGVEGGPLIG
ncbi:MAG: CNNM domain-containing protein, partial [Chloroflexota bacterium]